MIFRNTLLATLLLGTLAAASARAEPIFAEVTASHLPAGLEGPTMDAAVADVDGDSDPDIVLAIEFGRNRLLLNDGTGHFTDASDRLPANLRDSEEIAAIDVDGDGDLDLVFVSEDDRLDELYLNDGSGRFIDASNRLAAFARITNGLATADLDLDGFPDLVLGNNGPEDLLINDGTGHFVSQAGRRLPADASSTQDVDLGDVDGDGDLDLAIANEGANALYLNDGQGFFTDASSARLDPRPFGTTREVDLGDVDGDGDLDLLYANVDVVVGAGQSQNRLYLNDGQGFFTDASDGRLPADARRSFDADLYDVDLDGDLDVVSSNAPNATYRLLINDGGGRFNDETEALLPPGVSGNGFDAEIADFDGDGTPDLYLASRFGSDRLLLGTLEVLGCRDLRQRLRVRRCAKRLRALVRLKRGDHAGETVTFAVDGEPIEVEIRGKRAKLGIRAEAGEHTVELIRPAGCYEPATVECSG